ncbi:hypothetical protein PROFUN_00570 [Planoprotostelium fungivorum]|uniref:Atg6 BARA domain-containing protein n=1 Tax=Planoprotostelium fungivorum TaxID=1890364 RepID=A0A2P6N188_9EUKA|nr:hypothetical protein PROFUN_00570 [Planoprotostelium fungivorum]
MLAVYNSTITPASYITLSRMKSDRCKKCEKELGDPFVMVGDDTDSKTPRFPSSASVHDRLQTKAKIDTILEELYIGDLPQIDDRPLSISLDDETLLTIGEDTCLACNQFMILRLDEMLHEAEVEAKAYEGFLEREEIQFPTEELKEHYTLEKEWKKRVQDMSVERDKSRRELLGVKQESKSLDEREQQYFSSLTHHQYHVHQGKTEIETLDGRTLRCICDLETLSTVNVHRDMFYINSKEVVGSINRFRLGGTSKGIDPEELNAGLGQCALLLYLLCKQVDCKLVGLIEGRYRILPMGNRSQIQDENRTTVGDGSHINKYPLYGSGETQTEGWLSWSSLSYFGQGTNTREAPKTLDQGLSAYLCCLDQLAKYAKQKQPKLDIPYKIHGDTVGGFSIKISSKEEVWTRALKQQLIVLNYILAWASSKPK